MAHSYAQRHQLRTDYRRLISLFLFLILWCECLVDQDLFLGLRQKRLVRVFQVCMHGHVQIFLGGQYLIALLKIDDSGHRAILKHVEQLPHPPYASMRLLGLTVRHVLLHEVVPQKIRC